MDKSLSDFIPLEEGVNDPGIFKAVFLAGGPGSGKSFMVGRTALPALGLKVINSDTNFENALRRANMEPTPENIMSDAGQSIRAKAKYLTQKQLSLAVIGRLGLVIDGTGKDYDKIARQKATLENIGYECMLLFVNTDLETAQARNQKRPRTLPDNIVTRMWQDVQNNLGKFQNAFGNNLLIVDNSEGVNAESASLSAYRKITAWVSTPPRSYIAQRWMKKQRNMAMHESLKDWFGKGKKGDWVRVGTDGEIKGDCARDPGEGKPKCMPRSRAHSMDKEDRAKSARRKRRKDPDVDRPGTGNKPINVKTEAIDRHGVSKDATKAELKKIRSNPKSSKGAKDLAHFKLNMHHNEENIDEKCWDSHKQVGMKKKGGKMVPNCVPKNEDLEPMPKLSKLKPAKSPEQKKLIKGREKDKVFSSIAVEQTELEEISMSDRIKAKTIHKDKYAKLTRAVIADYRKDKQRTGTARHGVYYHAGEILRKLGGRGQLNSRILGDMAAQKLGEEYKYEWGTPEGTQYMKAVTPGEPGKTTKKNKTKSKNHYKAVDQMTEDVVTEAVELLEKSKPTNPGLWSRAKSAARAKFDVYPSAYANGWAVQWYKKRGGGWRSVKEGEEPEGDIFAEMYKSPAHKKLQGFMNKNRKSFAYQNKVRSMGGTPLKPGEQNKMVSTKEATDDEENFKPHMMYDPKTGKAVKAKKYADHIALGKKGYTHDKPEMKEENGIECQDGHYYCRQRKACVPIPKGYRDRGDGFIVKEEVDDAEYLQNLHQIEVHGFSDNELKAMELEVDQMTFDDFVDLGMYDEEELETVEADVSDYEGDINVTEVLSIQGRMKRRFTARRNRQKLKVARMRRARMASSPDRIKRRAARGARNMFKKRLARGRDVGAMPPAEKARIETMLKRFQPIVSKLAQRMIPTVRRAEIGRLKKRGAMQSQKAKKFKISKGGSASKYKAKKFKIKKAKK